MFPPFEARIVAPFTARVCELFSIDVLITSNLPVVEIVRLAVHLSDSFLLSGPTATAIEVRDWLVNWLLCCVVVLSVSDWHCYPSSSTHPTPLYACLLPPPYPFLRCTQKQKFAFHSLPWRWNLALCVYRKFTCGGTTKEIRLEYYMLARKIAKGSYMSTLERSYTGWFMSVVLWFRVCSYDRPVHVWVSTALRGCNRC